MKKIYSILLAVAVLYTPYLHAKTCFHNQCNYILNGAFASGSLSNWTTGGGNGVTTEVESSCYASYVARLDNTEYIYQDFYVDDTYSTFSLQFRAYLPGDTNNWYDQLTITVTNLDTSASESFSLRGSSYDTQCGLNVFNLQNDYSNANVRVKFQVATLALHPFQIDDVAFWATF